MAGLVIGTVAFPFVAPALLPISFGVTTKGIVLGSLLSVGASEGISLVSTGKHISPSEAVESAFLGGVFSAGTSIVLSKVIVPKVVTPWLQKSYRGAIESGKLWSPSIPQKVVMKLTGAKPRLAPSVVSYPTPKTVSMSSLKAQGLAWDLGASPKSSLLTVSKTKPLPLISIIKDTPLTAVPSVLKTLTYRQGQITYSRITEQLLVYQTPTKSLMPKIPFLPQIGIESTKQTSLGILGGFAGIVTRQRHELASIILTTPKPKQKQKIQIPTPILPKELQKPQLRSRFDLAPKQDQKDFAFIIQESQTSLVQKQVQKQTQKQIQKQKSINQIGQVLLPQTSMKVPSLSLVPVPFIRTPLKQRKKRKGKRLKEAWFKKTHPIKTPQEMFKTYSGERPKPKTNKKKKRRQKNNLGFF
ncbi:MAG: hypothetical protein ACXACY_26505 [Candidatus Hodarchaeales archaeon]|jgi:hypothetical protein